jgi:hypothetical protein
MLARCSIAEIARRIWFRRNAVFHGGEFMLHKFIIKASIDFIAAYRTVMEKDAKVGGFGAVPTVSLRILFGTHLLLAVIK